MFVVFCFVFFSFLFFSFVGGVHTTNCASSEFCWLCFAIVLCFCFVFFSFLFFSLVLLVVCIRRIVPPVSFVGCVLQLCFVLLVVFSEKIEFGCFVLLGFVLLCFVLFCWVLFCFGGGVRKTNSAFPVSFVCGAFFVVFFFGL